MSDATSPASTAPVTSPTGPQPAAGLTSVFAALEDHLRASYPNTFSGAVIEQHGSKFQVIIYRLPDPALDADVHARMAGYDVGFEDSSYSYSSLSGVARRINADKAYWKDRRIAIGSALVAGDGSTVVVDCSTPLPAAQDAFTSRYGADAMRMVLLTAGEPGGGTYF